jgi:thymidine phosphorylase
MDQPLAWSAGNALEVREAISFLAGDARHTRLAEVVEALSAELLFLGGLSSDRAPGREMVRQVLDSGRAAEQFALMVSEQGGPAALLEQPERYLPVAPIVRPVFPSASGYVSAIDTRAVGMAVIALGGGRQRVEDSIDPAVGISRITGIGGRVDSSVPLAMVHASSEDGWRHAKQLLRNAYTLSVDPTEDRPVIHAQIEGNTIDG